MSMSFLPVDVQSAWSTGQKEEVSFVVPADLVHLEFELLVMFAFVSSVWKEASCVMPIDHDNWNLTQELNQGVSTQCLRDEPYFC